MKKYIKVVLLVCWMGLIFYFSSQDATGSTVQTNVVIDYIYKIYTSLVVNNKLSLIEFSNIVFTPVRKMAHFTEFMVLGVLSYLCVKDHFNKYISLAIIISVIYAISDEIHQIFVPGRACAITDMLIDSLGAIVGIVLIHFVLGKCIRRKH